MNAIETLQPELLQFPWDAIGGLSPSLVLVATILFSVLFVVSHTRWAWNVVFASVFLGLVGVATFAGLHLEDASVTVFGAMASLDSFTQAFTLMAALAAASTVVISKRYLEAEGLAFGEYFLLILFSLFGMIWMVAALDLIVLFVALEIMSLSVYMLVGFRRADRKGNEASLKYFILGGVASAVLLYGTAMLYGATGSLQLREILAFAQAHSSNLPTLFVLGVGMVLSGFLFKVAAVPFHAWMPDVYEGAPTPIAGFMTTGLKAASFAALIRFFIASGFGKGIGESVALHARDILWVLAALTMLLGNVVALMQTNLKRMLAYSSIAHTGYLLVGLLGGSHSEFGFGPMVLYLLAYTLMNLGAFSVLTLLGGRSDTALQLQDMAGLARKHPGLAFALSVFLFSMAGVPPTAGFVAKYMVLFAGVQAGETALVVIAVLCSAVSVYYYLRVLVYMYMREPIPGAAAAETACEGRAFSAASMAVVFAMVLATLWVGVLPSQWVELAKLVVLPL